NGLKLHQRPFRVDIRKKFCRKRAVKHWSRLPKEVVELPFLAVLNKHVDQALRDMV
ncbi:hypothetical protein N309_02400, partial [Tinamus guttatus]